MQECSHLNVNHKKLLVQAQEVYSSDGKRKLKRADGTKFTQITIKNALKVLTKMEIEELEKAQYAFTITTRGGKCIQL